MHSSSSGTRTSHFKSLKLWWLKTYNIVYDIVYDIILHILYDVVGAYDIVYEMQYNIVYDVVYYVVYNIVYVKHRPIYSCCLSAAAKRRRFKVAAPLRLDSETRARRIALA